MDKEFLNNKSFVLLSSIFIVLFLSILLGAAFLSSESQIREVDQRISMHEAFYSAEAGIERAIFELRRNPSWGDEQGQSGQAVVEDISLEREDNTIVGYYTVFVQDGGVLDGWNTRIIRSIGTDAKEEIKKIIESTVRIENPARFLVATLGNLRIGSGANITADILGQDIFFDVNEALPEEDRLITVNGDIFYLSSINDYENEAVTITGLHEKIPSITFTGVDLQYYNELLLDNLIEENSGVLVDGDLVVDLNNLDELTEEPEDNFMPKLILAKGDVYLSGEYGHSLLVVAGGNVYINGNILPDESVTERPQIGIFAKKDVIIPSGLLPQNSDLTIEAFIVADGKSDESEGMFVAEDPTAYLGTLNFNGAISVRGSGRTGVDLNSFKTRNFIFNSELNSNRSIPFSPFIVNVVEWKDVTFSS